MPMDVYFKTIQAGQSFGSFSVYGPFFRQLLIDVSFSPKVNILQLIKNKPFITEYYLDMLLLRCQKSVQINVAFNVTRPCFSW